MKNPILPLTLFLSLLVAACGGSTAENPGAGDAPKDITIGMVTIASHPSLDAIQQGVKDRLAEAGYVNGENITILEGNAEGDIATLTTIIQRYIDEDVDLIVATTTPAAQAAYNVTQEAQGPPVIYNGVSNPYIAGLAESSTQHPAWMVGSQLLDPVVDALDLAGQLIPGMKVVGIIYNPAEANSEYLVDVARSVADERDLTLEIAPISNSSEIQTAAESLLGREIDFYLALSDNTLTSGFEALVQTANENHLPIIGTSASMPGLGAAVSYGIDPYQEGLDSGDLVVQYLEGTLDIAEAPIEIQDSVLLTINPKAASVQAVDIPQSLLESADSVVE